MTNLDTVATAADPAAGPDDDPASRPLVMLLPRLERALKLRERLYRTPYYRLVHAEADGLPGLVVDRFGPVLVIQTHTAGMALLQPLVVDALRSLVAPDAVVLRDDSPARAMEGLGAAVRAGGLHLPRLVLAQCRRRRVRRGGAARSCRCGSRRPHPARGRGRTRPPDPPGAARKRLSQVADAFTRLGVLAADFFAAGTVTWNTVPAPVEATSTRSPPCSRVNSRAIARPSPLPPGRAEPANGRNKFSRARGGRPGPSSAISIATTPSSVPSPGAAAMRSRCAPASTALRARLRNTR